MAQSVLEAGWKPRKNRRCGAVFALIVCVTSQGGARLGALRPATILHPLALLLTLAMRLRVPPLPTLLWVSPLDTDCLLFVPVTDQHDKNDHQDSGRRAAREEWLLFRQKTCHRPGLCRDFSIEA